MTREFTVTLPNGSIIKIAANNMDEAKQKSFEYMHKHYPTSIQEQMLYQAMDFHRLVRDLDLKNLDREGLKGKPTIFMVNASFGLEIYLKLAVRISNNIHKRGHDLNKIFDALPTKSKEEIENIVRSIIQKQKITNHQNTTAKSIVEKTKTAFKDWRYRYENNKLLDFHCDELIILLYAMHHYCKKYVKLPTEQESQ